MQIDGHIQALREDLETFAARHGLLMTSILLEVRPSNLRALKIYRRYGYVEIGQRKDYYPANNGMREDAIVMRLEL